SAANEPRRIAVKTDDNEISYRQILSDAYRLADQFKLLGCTQGVKVAIALNNSAEYLVSFFAISAAGGIILPLSTRMTPYEVARCIDRTDASIVITNRKYGKQLHSKLSGSNRITMIYVYYAVNKNLEVETGILGRCQADEENGDVALMVPTSGTTGMPKIVMLTDSNLISNMATYRSLMGFNGHNTVYSALSMHHIYCICAQILTHISLADTFVISDNPFFIKDFLKAVEAHNITITAFVPYMAILMAEYPEPHRFNLESLKYITLSGAKTPPSTYRLLTEKYGGIQFINTYGLSEAGSRVSIAAPFPNRFPIESVGRPMPEIDVRIVDEKRNIAAANFPGEIVIKSSGVMKGYYKQPDLTSETIINGWLKTGDLGKLDENGNLFILGRTKDIIVTGGENVCPLEIEECLLEHPAIHEAAVVARKHSLLQEVPCAFIVKNNHSDKPTPVDITEFCKSRLSNHKIPSSVIFLEKLPKLSSSKVDRATLKKMADELC
ncbi:MAG: class I adenylate-forming enzyme family protein, partial [Planctomycetota bacterium]|nr:class I adenylate-forming enzyme family protein [Planctomycetota bacterium]